MGAISNARFPGIEVREYASGKKSIRILFMYKGVPCRETLKNIKVNAVNLKYARNLKAQIEHEITLGTFDYLKHFPGSKRGLKLAGGSSSARPADIEKQYRQALNARPVEFATIQTYESALRAWVLPAFGNVPLVQIDAKMITREKDLLLMRLAPKSVANYLGVLRDFFAWAVSQDYMQENPVQNVTVGRQAAKRQDSIEPFTRDEITAILAATKDRLYRNYLEFAFFTGLRTSEMYGLTWQDVDWTRETVFIHQVRVKGKLKPNPKTDAGRRDVLLVPAALAALKRQRAETELLPHGFVWVDPGTREPLVKYSTTARRWKTVLKRARMRYRNPYQTRHTYASNLLSDGENPWFIARQLGHEDVQMVMRVYGRYIEQAGRIENHRWVSDFGFPGNPPDYQGKNPVNANK